MCGVGAEQGAVVQGGPVAGVERVAGVAWGGVEEVGAGGLTHFVFNSEEVDARDTFF